jgi:hypothetical protein
VTHVSRLDYLGVTAKNIRPDVRDELRKWRRGVLGHPREGQPLDRALSESRVQYGLWLFGERFAGTSYIGQALTGRMCFQEGLAGVERVTAAELIEHTKDVWSFDQMVRRNGEDMAVWGDMTAAQAVLERYFTLCDLLWVDDFHHETIQMPFWKRYVQPYLEERVKGKLPTIVSTTCPPDDDSMHKKVIEGLFHVVFCDGYRPEKDAYDYGRP